MKDRVGIILKRVSQLVVFLAFLSAFGMVVVHVQGGGQRLGRLTPFFWEFVTFPRTVKEAWEEAGKPSETLIRYRKDVEAVNKLDYDVYAINAHFQKEQKRWMMALSNLKDDSVLHRWYLAEDSYNRTDREFSNAEPRTCVLLEDWSLLVKLDDTKNLYRLNKDSEVLWHNTDYIYHHTMNLGSEGHLWACSAENTYIRSRYIEKPRRSYYDNSVTHIDISTGEVMEHISVSDMLIDNDYLGLAFGMSSGSLPIWERDPFHLNDVEPALEPGTYWEKGDLFLSLRNRSSILQYRPSNHKIIRVTQGNFMHQHDVDILSDSLLALYNNNMPNLPTTAAGKVANANPPKLELGSSEVMTYHLRDSSFQVFAKERFEEEEIFSLIQGSYTFLENGDLFVENSRTGLIYVLNGEEVLLRGYTSSPENGLVEKPYWIRIYEDLSFLEGD